MHAGQTRVAHTLSFMYAPHEHAQHLCHRVLSMACPGFLTVADIVDTAGGAYMPLFGMCAISKRPAGGGRSERDGQSRWLLNGARGRGYYCHAVLAPPHFTSHTSQEARCTCPDLSGCATRDGKSPRSMTERLTVATDSLERFTLQNVAHRDIVYALFVPHGGF